MEIIGVDLGGSHVLATIVDESGRVIERAEHETGDRNVDPAIATIARAIAAVRDRASRTSIGVIGLGSPGSIDLSTGVVKYSPNFGWRDVPLGERLREEFGVPVFVANDARCAALGEYAFGAGRGTANFVLLTLGTGIGGGIVMERNLLLGSNALAGKSATIKFARPTASIVIAERSVASRRKLRQRD